MAKIALLGFGVVGSGVVQLMETNAAQLTKAAGEPLELAYILDRKDLSGTPYAAKKADAFETILADDSVTVVVEAMGGVEPAYSWLKAALLAGKNVVTSNKELVAEKGADLLAAAKEKGVNFLFEASVAGGIPILHPLHHCLGANRIEEIAGILNGTTNFILTKMFGEGMGFDEALAIAQELGYAEADPTADVEGIDACRKLCIMASMAYGKHVYPSGVHTQGITAITADDVAYAEANQYKIKLIGRCRQDADGKVQAQVTPALLKKASQLAGIDDVFNGVLVRGDAVGDLVFYGRGAGALPTGSAVLSDVIECCRAGGHMDTIDWADSDGSNLAAFAEYPVQYYLRLEGACEELEGAVALARADSPPGERAFITPMMTEGKAAEYRAQLEAKGVKVLSAIAVLDY